MPITQPNVQPLLSRKQLEIQNCADDRAADFGRREKKRHRVLVPRFFDEGKNRTAVHDDQNVNFRALQPIGGDEGNNVIHRNSRTAADGNGAKRHEYPEQAIAQKFV